MTYYAGKPLQSRVTDFGLEDFYALIQNVAAGKQPWPGIYRITPAIPENLEPLRVTIYSILHETGVKPQFKVKMFLGSLLVEEKKQRNQSFGEVVTPGGEIIKPGDALHEGLESLFEEE
jgi:hypothetical protein